MWVLGIRTSGDGLRWTAPRRSQRIVERAFHEATLRTWTETGSAEVPEYTSTDDGMSMETPRGRMELRWLD